MTKELYLVADFAGARVAIASGLVESVVQIPEVVTVPKSDPTIAGIFALRSRVLTLIDTQFLITGVRQVPEKGMLAVVTEIAGHQYGLLVDKVHDVVAISNDQVEATINAPPIWAPYVSRVASHDDALLMILNTATLVTGQSVFAD